MKKQLAHLASRIFGVPLAIAPRKLSAILNGLSDRLRIDAGSLAVAADASPATKQDRRPYAVTADGVALIDVFGSLVHRATGMDAWSGLTSYEDLGAELAQAVQDDGVKAIVLRVDSPGGEVSGMFDVADQVRAAAGVKPVVAFAADCACSAAYLIASAATKLVVSQSATIGSIGIVLAHTDTTAAEAAAGVKVQYLHAGENKVNGAYGLDAEHKAAIDSLQAEVDKFYGLFIGAVARYRGISPDVVRKTEASIYIGADAVKLGLADAVVSQADAQALAAQLAGIDDATPASKDDAFMFSGKRVAPTGTDRTTGMVPGAVIDPAASGMDQEIAMGEIAKKSPADGAGEVTDLAAAKAEIEKLRGEKAKAEAATEVAKASLVAAEEQKKIEVIAKHQKRGAVVPAMLPSVTKLAATCATAAELDKELSTFVEVLHASATGTSDEKKAEGSSLSADDAKLLRKLGISQATVQKFDKAVGVSIDGKVLLADGTRISAQDFNAGRA